MNEPTLTPGARPPALAQRDLRGTRLWTEVEAFYRESYRGLFGRFSAVGEAALSPDRSSLAFTGSGLDSLMSGPWRQVYVQRGDEPPRAVGRPDHHSSRPKWSPDGRWLAFLETGVRGAQPPSLVFWQASDGSLTSAADAGEMGVEDFAWDPAGERVLSWTREQAAILPTVPRFSGADWMPVARSSQAPPRQTVALVSPDGASQPLPTAPLWIWEAAWIGKDALAAIASGPGEPADWYRAELGILHLDGRFETRYRPRRQIGRLTGHSPSGRAAVVEGTASDRGMVAGEVVVVDLAATEHSVLSVQEADVTYVDWTDDADLTCLGLARQRTVLGSLDLADAGWTETWSSPGSCGMPMPVGQVLAPGTALIAYEDWHTPRQLRIVGRPLHDEPRLGVDCAGRGSAWQVAHKGHMSEVAWTSDDGTELEGLLVVPDDRWTAPYPLVINIHGGPVWAWRNTWDIVGHTPVALLVSRGFAVLNPNGRGSVGWGPELQMGILGEMGRRDLADYTSAGRHLVESGIADPQRLSIIGHSYGGTTVCSLVTDSTLFAAAVALSPVSGWLSQHHLSGIPGFDEVFVGDVGRGSPPHGPITAIDAVRTPTLLVGCEQDDCTPANQAIEFYRALARAGGTPAALALYPSEGHGIERWPALMDQSVRIVEWLERYAGGHDG